MRMKKRWLILALLAAALAAVFLPAVTLHVHSQLGEETAALFPASVSMGDMALRGADCLPTDQVPALKLIRFEGWMLTVGLVLMALGCVAALCGKKGSLQAGAVITALAMAFLGAFALQLKNLCDSLLFTLLMGAQAWIYVPFAAAAVQLIFLLVLLRGAEPLPVNDQTWRRLGGVLALAAVLMMALPAHVVSVPPTVTADPADAAAMTRTLSMFGEALGNEQNLAAVAKENGVFSQVLTGDLQALEPYSADGNNIRGIFTITTSTAAPNVLLLAGAALLLLGAALSFIPRVDRWFPLSLTAVGAVLTAASSVGVMSAGSGDMFSTASRQLNYLGLGGITPVPLLALALAAGAAVCGAMSVRRANNPYFVNPIPKKSRLRVTAVVLAVLAIAAILLPGGQLSFYRPGQTRVQSTADLGGVQALAFTTPEAALHPKTSRGLDIYSDEAADGQWTAAQVADSMRSLSTGYSVTTWVALVLAMAGMVLVLLHREKKAAIALFVAAIAARLVSWLLMAVQMPSDVGTASATIYLYASLPLLLFAAFFANFADMEELPRKYRLFLMMLPFLLAVFLFSYLPLSGWSYAFYNYRFGLPLSKQEFVGFKWFTEMITNPGHRENVVRVLRNTFAMSGLGLATSWLPMVFAIFLNEISNTRFRKFVQIFTTLPNFISWALVFSFAMCLFSMETGIFTKFMMAIGAINQPVAWLNSPNHIWLKMWAWGTWKGLGWSAIMYLAAIAGIDQELYEAARVDGAGRWMQMRYITFPSLLPTFFVLLMLSISNILSNGMDQYLVFQNSMNKNTIEVLDLYVYNITIAAKGDTLYSFSTAIGILKTVVSVTLLFTANFASKKLRGESIV